jgi:recombinational DNA repair protein RecR
VFDGAERVSSVWWDVQNAEDRMERMLREAARVTRPCITCGRAFKSDGAHNRMCNPCRQTHRDTARPYNTVAPRRGATSRSES